jgi:hypothetical protein
MKFGKTKIGIALIGASAFIASCINYSTFAPFITQVIAEVGGVATCWGIRDWPVFNKK